ncbi:MAG: dihydroorotate dehydrogenase electron transfer subunit [Clostridiales bacterium]|jgi:dihydroorotate dehydrogenase electron transfer subunit|nr:dihydroorotate dehydrogenase electron transfer subunit [Clostridiales bacterium]
MKTVNEGIILRNELLTNNPAPIYDMYILAPKMFENAGPVRPGQFVMLYTGKGEMLLPRPISICEAFSDETVRLVYQVAGQGTEYFSSLEEDARIGINGPLGNGFAVEGQDSPPAENRVHFLIGGGIGVPPLLSLAKEIHLRGEKAVAVLGFRDEPILIEDFKEYCDAVHIATDSGKHGFRGNAVQLLNNILNEQAYLYACGPRPLLKSLCEWADERGLPLQISMEERMACGIGACVGCSVKIKSDYVAYKRVCADGPVFFGNEVVF